MRAISKARVSVMVPSEVYSALDRHSQASGSAMGEIVASALRHYLKISIQPMAAPPKPEKPPTIIELIGRGYTANQIAAITKLPYREVMVQLGKQIDIAMAKKRA